LMITKIINFMEKISYINLMFIGSSFFGFFIISLTIKRNVWNTLDIILIISGITLLLMGLLLKLRGGQDIERVTLKDMDNMAKRNINSQKLEYTYLNQIEIKNYFSIKNIELLNLKDKKEIYFVGKNGDGKTVLLQAILLALKKEYAGRVIEYIRDIQNEMSLWVEVSDYPNKYHSNLDIKNVFAYGINRNKIDKNFDKYGYMGLFDSSDFRDTTYLKDPIDILNKKEKLVEAFIKEMNKYILLDNLEIKRDKKRIYFIENDIEIEFDKLSEGYKSSIIWVTDLFSRLLENQKDIKKIQEFRAIVLIDEIDLYLHPKWQYAFVNGLREMFPLIQFFIITHSPTIILGASMDAVYYHIYKENGETKVSEQQEVKNDFLNDIQTDIFNFDVNEERINNPTNDNKRRQQRAKEGLLNLIETIEQEEK